VERADVVSIARATEHRTSLVDQNIYWDPDPPTPNWGC
jgi:hypothetical protein